MITIQCNILLVGSGMSIEQEADSQKDRSQAVSISMLQSTAPVNPMKNQLQTQFNVVHNDGDWEIGGDVTESDYEAEHINEVSSPSSNPSSPSANYRVERALSSKGMSRTDSQKPSNGEMLGSKSGITSSPSFQELERAIGESLAMNLTTSASSASLGGDSDLGDSSIRHSRNHSSGNMISRLSGTDLTLQKVQQQSQKRNRQPQNQRYSPSQQLHQHHLYTQSLPKPTQEIMKSPLDTRAELAVHINESESRALILFHSPELSPVTVRDACQKFGVLYYIRPEFHSKGVTLLSYFDLRIAIRAQAALPEELGDNQASAHFSIMLHATNSNTEEYRLVVQNLPEGRADMTEVETIFARYGQLRSIQRIFSDNDSARQSPTTSAFSIEYFNIQDARLAASELGATTSQLWGPDILVGFAPLDTRKQLLCRQLLGTLSRWRTTLSPFPVTNHHMSQMPMIFPQDSFGYRPSSAQGTLMIPTGYHNHSNVVSMAVPLHMHHMPYAHQPSMNSYSHSQSSSNSHDNQRAAQLSNIELSQHPCSNVGDNIDEEGSILLSQHQQMQYHQYYSNSKLPPPAINPQHMSQTSHRNNHQNIGYIGYDQRPQHHNGGYGRKVKAGVAEDVDFTLNIDRLKIGDDTRTTIMVRTRFTFKINFVGVSFTYL